MIWRSPIFSKQFGARPFHRLCLTLALCMPCSAAMVKGQVVLVNSRERSVKKLDYSDVVISLKPLNAATHEGPPRHLRMLQKNKAFQPHVLAAEVGSVIDFPNADPIFHNAFSSYSGQIFDIGLYPPGKSRSVRLERPGIVRVFCNIHQWMSAVIVVVDSPYFAITNASGSFSIDAPPGDYQLRVYHERATEETLRGLERPLHVSRAGVDLPVIRVSEAGYLPSPHKNKHGQDYAPLADDRVAYPGVRN
jgi:plastocyanin